MTRLLMVKVVGNPAAVLASLLTVFVPALVIETTVWPKKGGTFSDQLAPFSHLPLLSLTQLLAPPATATRRASENSVSALPVAETKRPGARGVGKLRLKLPAPSVSTLRLNSNVLPSPWPDGSMLGSANSSR